MLINWCLGFFGASTFIKLAKDYGAKKNIERKGLHVISDPRSFVERTFSFVNDYFYLLIPGYNIYKTFQLIRINGNEYAGYREAILEDRERIITKEQWDIMHGIKPVKKEEKKEEVKEVKKEESLKPIKQNTQNTSKMDPIKTQNTSKRVVITDEEYIELKRRMDANNKLDKKLRERLKALEIGKASVPERNEVIKKLWDLDKEYKTFKQMELDYLRNKRDTLNNIQSNGMKLTRK